MEDAGPIAGMILGLLLLDALVYGYSSALQNLDRIELENRAEEKKDPKSIRLLKLVDRQETYVGTVQLITTFADMAVGVLYLIFIQTHPGAEIAVAAAVVLLYLFLTFGVLLPKKIAARHAERLAYLGLAAAELVRKLFRPMTALVGATVSGILFLFGVRDKSEESDVTEKEIINMVQEGFEQGVIEDNEAEMINNIFAYGDKQAQDIMTHRNNVVAIDGEMHLKDAIDFMLAGTNSRYPVYEENIDHVIGILHLKDAMRYHRRDTSADGCVKDLDGLLREAYFVPQTKNIDELFEEMQSKKLQMAIVVDEYGQMDGLVAMEDILEEIVGNIMDEYDEDTDYIEEKGNDEYIIEGKTPLEELAERFGIVCEEEEVETLNGFMIRRMDHIPEENERFDVDYKGYNFKVLSVENKMVQSVLVTKLPEQASSEENGAAENENVLL
ncbi:MAG: HlyC/CorC family transporter [Lachnospiraceae bacterium]|nr:HlyC/CorC family transporter [Lachnospiraceae bacterium]